MSNFPSKNDSHWDIDSGKKRRIYRALAALLKSKISKSFFTFYFLRVKFSMGRKSKNITYKEMLEAGRKRAIEYYRRNREECRRKSLERYYRIKNASLE